MHIGLDFNEDFERAMRLLEEGRSVFITGKAGTGKSTLLRYFLQTTTKKTVVAAPTGVAALNIGGQTIHRLFSFPASVTADFPGGREYFPARNAKVLKSLEVLIIDEVSMVRADLFDAVELALRRFGPRSGEPFGGVQMVFVGDPYQLPPVVTDAEETHFRTRYATPYFFSADAFGLLDYDVVQLERVYRQRDDEFIRLLNAVRTGDASQEDLDALNSRYLPDFEPPKNEFWITLTTTNAMADLVNNTRLEELSAPLLVHMASKWGEVESGDKSVADELRYKVGAQVMLLTNDPGGAWVNGSMGVVTGTRAERGTPIVSVGLVTGGEIEVEPHTWEITHPVIEDGRLSYEAVGGFTQLPFRLGWAVTIHKSQGQTLDRVIVSLGRGTFADGQLYVALSRCTSLPGLVLKSEVKKHHIKVEHEVTRFLARARGHRGEAVGHACIGVLTTGMGRSDRIMEIGVVVQRDGQSFEFSTLVNPMRDIGNAADSYGLSASDLSLAPTFAEAWPWLARRIDGCVLVAHGLPLIQTMVERECAASGLNVNLGLGLDTLVLTKTNLDEAAASAGVALPDHASALDLARATAAVFAREEVAAAVTSPYIVGAEGKRVGNIRSRHSARADPLTVGDPALAYADAVSLAMGSQVDEDTAQESLAALAKGLGLSDDAISEAHTRALDSLVVAAIRDGLATEEERAALTYAARILGLAEPNLGGAATHAEALILEPGSRVCFTGSAVGVDGQPLERSDLEALALQAGLVPVSGVSKTRCDALIAADPASMSGKAKKARELGKPVYSVGQFLDWLGHPG